MKLTDFMLAFATTVTACDRCMFQVFLSRKQVKSKLWFLHDCLNAGSAPLLDPVSCDGLRELFPGHCCTAGGLLLIWGESKRGEVRGEHKKVWLRGREGEM